MTHHWESSGRPLFVKTVYVNGNRHAILSQEDPLVHSGNSIFRKQNRSDSSLSFNSTVSSNSSRSQGSNSDVKTNFSKSHFRRPHSRDISTELQRCLVKLRFPTNVQENKEQTGEEKKIFSLQVEEDIKMGNKHRRKKWKNSKNNKKHVEEHCNYDEPISSNMFSEIAGNQTNLHGSKQKLNFTDVTSSPSHLIVNCSCGCRGWCNIHGFLTLKEPMKTEGRKNEFSETLHSFIVPTEFKSPGKKGVENSQLHPNSAIQNTCEFYWNKYLTASFNTSLTERVIQWIDLAGRQKLDDKLKITNEGRTPGKSVQANDFTRNKCQERLNEKKLESKKDVHTNRELVLQKNSFDVDVEAEIKVDVDSNVISFVEKLEKENTRSSGEAPNEPGEVENYMTAMNLEKSLEVEEQVNRNDESQMSSIAQKINPNLSESVHLQRSITNQIEQSFPNTEQSEIKITSNVNVHFYTQNKPAKPTNRLSTHESTPGLDEIDGCDQNFKIRSIKVFKKKGTSVKDQKNYSVRTNNVFSETLKLIRERNAAEAARVTKYQDWINEVLNKNYVTVNDTPVTRTTLNRNVLPEPMEDVFCLRQSKTAWEPEASLDKPQLHIFIPSLPQKEVGEESLSECESFL
ncbi:hypothetical protein RUM44_006106 [Polyplax serrata]|uniref:Uncharacterized protein n=1 Tax=Polyplax serrata TaxID=468196 RepID=A0ABR1B0K7_POLSC